MNESWTIVVLATLGVFITIGIGAGARRLSILTAEADRSLMNLVICVLMPCFIFSKVAPNDALDASNLLLPPLIGYMSVVIGMAVAAGIVLLCRFPGLTASREIRTFALSVGLYNYGYLPIPLIQALSGEQNPLIPESTLGVLFVHNVGVDLCIWTLGVLVIQGQLVQGWWKKVLNPPSIAVMVALIVNLAGIYSLIPAFIQRSIETIGQAGIPMSMILIGATMMDQLVPKDGEDQESLVSANGLLQMALATGVRMGILPIVFLLAAVMLPLSDDLRRVIIVQAAMPAAVFPVVLARVYQGNPKVATRIVLGTSLVSIVTIPLWIYAGIYFLSQ